MLSHILLSIAGIASLIFVFKMAMLILGLDHDATDTDDAFDLFSVQTLSCFFMSFGWSSLAGLMDWGLGNILSLFVGFSIAVAVTALYLLGMRMLYKLNTETKRDYTKCIGKQAVGYTPLIQDIPGQVEVTLDGKSQILFATNKDKHKVIQSGKTVRILGVENSILIVDEN